LAPSFQIFPEMAIWNDAGFPNPAFSVCVDDFHVSNACGYSNPSNAMAGFLISAAHNALFEFCSGSLDWDSSTPSGTSIRFQLRSAPDSLTLQGRSWVGPNGTDTTYYETPGPLWIGHDGDLWIQYRASLSASSPYVTPVLDEVRVHYVSCQTGIADSSDLPAEITELHGYPSPSNSSCTVGYTLPKESRVRVTIYNVDGSPVRTLVDSWREPGVYSEVWDGKADDGSALPSGVYFYSLKAGDFVATRKMVLLH